MQVINTFVYASSCSKLLRAKSFHPLGLSGQAVCEKSQWPPDDSEQTGSISRLLEAHSHFLTVFGVTSVHCRKNLSQFHSIASTVNHCYEQFKRDLLYLLFFSVINWKCEQWAASSQLIILSDKFLKSNQLNAFLSFEWSGMLQKSL